MNQLAQCAVTLKINNSLFSMQYKILHQCTYPTIWLLPCKITRLQPTAKNECDCDQISLVSHFGLSNQNNTVWPGDPGEFRPGVLGHVTTCYINVCLKAIESATNINPQCHYKIQTRSNFSKSLLNKLHFEGLWRKISSLFGELFTAQYFPVSFIIEI